MPEHFEAFDDRNRPLGLLPRQQVHARGLWHRSAHVFLFTPGGELYVQRRAVDKDLFPDRWDLSVGEHLKPGESYLQGALRGLAEELGVTGAVLEALGSMHRSECRVPELGVVDRELQQAFRGTHPGPITPDPEEVAEVRAISLKELACWVTGTPDAFTPWFLEELHRFELLPGTPP